MMVGYFFLMMCVCVFIINHRRVGLTVWLGRVWRWLAESVLAIKLSSLAVNSATSNDHNMTQIYPLLLYIF